MCQEEQQQQDEQQQQQEEELPSFPVNLSSLPFFFFKVSFVLPRPPSGGRWWRQWRIKEAGSLRAALSPDWLAVLE